MTDGTHTRRDGRAGHARRAIVVMATVGLMLAAASGCGTVRGVGEDLETAGRWMQQERHYAPPDNPYR